jgi:hypothetical protein
MEVMQEGETPHKSQTAKQATIKACTVVVVVEAVVAVVAAAEAVTPVTMATMATRMS